MTDLIEAIAAAGIAQVDPCMGTLFVRIAEAELYATPGWEGVDGVDWVVHDDDCAVVAHGTVSVNWTGVIAADVELYRAILANIMQEVA